MESVSIAMDKARILHEVQGTQIVIEFEKTRLDEKEKLE